MAARARPHADGAVFRVAAERDVLGMHAAAQAGDAGAETGVVEARARGHAVGLLIGQGGKRRTHAQRRPAVLGSEGIEVEREGGGGEEGAGGECEAGDGAHGLGLRSLVLERGEGGGVPVTGVDGVERLRKDVLKKKGIQPCGLSIFSRSAAKYCSETCLFSAF